MAAKYTEAALDRFAQFFIDPLFMKSKVNQEIEVIDSENNRYKGNENWRINTLMRNVMAPTHPSFVRQMTAFVLHIVSRCFVMCIMHKT